mmetsp:Transcript_24070/g.56920  ORF Transcript_24070/g.56920 Transcript_24070/m.56920 type:complete len:624 (-) Transcript_24070:175-2046(-)
MGNSASSTSRAVIAVTTIETEVTPLLPQAQKTTTTTTTEPTTSSSMADTNENPTTIEATASGETTTHMLASTVRGASDIEKIVLDIESKRSSRLEVTFRERKHFLEICYEIAKREGRGSRSKNRFPKSTLVKLRDEFQNRMDEKHQNGINKSTVGKVFANVGSKCLDFFGCQDIDESMLRLFEAGLEYTESVDEDEFYFQDFNFYCTRLVSRFVWMRYPQLVVVGWLFLYFFGSAVVFCAFMRNENVCPSTTNFAYGGWMTAVYFAGVTMSTVGYGDVSLYDEDKPGVTFVGTIYMLVAILVGYLVFSTAAEMSFGGIFGWDVYSIIEKRNAKNPDMPLYKQVNRLVWLRTFELGTYFVALNLIGALISRAFVNRSPLEEEQWNWSTTIYWAVQTTTTIGYGDLAQPFLLRWVNIFFVTFGTAFVGSVFGSLASMRSEINDLRRYHAWKRRDVSRQLIRELQVNDDKLDQFEFVLGSLILLGKVGSDDIMNIMDKFRELAGTNGYIADIDTSDSKDGEGEVNAAVDAPEAPAGDIETTNNDDNTTQEQPGQEAEGAAGDNTNIPVVPPTTSTIIDEIPNSGRPNLFDIFKGPSAGTFRLRGDGGDKETDDPQYMDMDVPSSRF